MSQFGLSFVAVDYYWRNGAPAFDQFIVNALASSVSPKPKVCPMYCWDYGITEFRAALLVFASYAQNPGYFYINGRPVVFIYTAAAAKTSAGGTTSQMRALLDSARSTTNWYFVAISDTASLANGSGPDSLLAAGYDSVTSYNMPATTWGAMDNNYTAYYQAMCNSSIAHILPISTGFNRTNWGTVAYQADIDTIAKFEAHLRKAKAFLDYSYDRNQGMAIIEAWNEYGEGGVLEPSVLYADTRGLKVKEVFGL